MRIIYGINPVTEALASGEKIERIFVSRERKDRAIEKILTLSRKAGVEVKKVAAEEIFRLAKTTKHQGVAAEIAGEFKYFVVEDLIEAWKKTDTPAFFLILDSIQDPQNLGSLIRTANAAGVHGVIVPKDRSSEVTPAVVKASAGATEHTLIARETNLVRAIEKLKQENVWVVGVETQTPQDIYASDLKRDLALVIGSEDKGIRRLVREKCDFLVYIPMSGKINSLNAAQAGAIALFEAKRQRSLY